MARRTKVLSKDCIEVIFKDGKPQRVYPTHGWWHIFLRLAQLEDKQEPKKTIEDGAFGYCPCCSREFNSELMNEYDLKYCLSCGQNLDR